MSKLLTRQKIANRYPSLWQFTMRTIHYPDRQSEGLVLLTAIQGCSASSRFEAVSNHARKSISPLNHHERTVKREMR